MQHDSLFVFDIETVPDVETGKILLNSTSDSTEELRQSLVDYHLKVTDGKNSFLRQPFHRVVAISFLEAKITRDYDGNESYQLLDIRTGGKEDSSEEEMIKGLFSHLAKRKPRFVSFNGRNFDFPVLKYRAMKFGVSAPWLYNTGDKWNNYHQKFSLDWHCDLVDAFSDFGSSARLKMNEICACLGLPGKTGIDGSMVAEMFDRGEIGKIRDYCETDVINTYLLYLHFQNFSGKMRGEDFAKAKAEIVEFLQKNKDKAHFAEFLAEMENLR